ncbi:MAG: hypothetical protein AB1489_38560, partial [Acidobacteriota bacterium]
SSNHLLVRSSIEMKDTETILEEFAELGMGCAFDLKTGLHYEGYILEVEDQHILYSSVVVAQWPVKTDTRTTL